VPAQDNHPLTDLFPWVIERLDQPLTVEDLARQARMSSRNLGRHFRAATGTTPLQWLLPQRIRRARSCWRPPTTVSTPSRQLPAWAPPRRCADTSDLTRGGCLRSSGCLLVLGSVRPRGHVDASFPLARLDLFRAELHACFSRRADALFELATRC
jgi:hypothetical protein